ncbi:MAG: hypothetical protein IKN43_13825 [Selenomonadaceae bacterium]|nr:hypothetical protein [Selenomonadaceae bacterium]
MYKNQSGYPDPTAGAAIGKVIRAERRKHKKRAGYQKIKKIYVASKYAGDVDVNTNAAIDYCRYVIDQGFMPVASHLLYPQILDDNLPHERQLGLKFGLALLAICDEVWLFTVGGEISSGMEREIEVAKRLGIPLRKLEMGER